MLYGKILATPLYNYDNNILWSLAFLRLELSKITKQRVVELLCKNSR